MKKNLGKGYTLESLQWALINQGYSRTHVARAVERANQELADAAPILKEKPQITYQRVDEDDIPIVTETLSPKKSWWKSLFG